MVRAKISAPPSGSSSRFTDVTTAYRKPMRATASATRSGSSSSGGPSGFPLGTAQNPHARVQMLPKIMKVAVRCSQHSPMFGQRALSQTVCRSRGRIIPFNSWEFVPPKYFTRSHDGRGWADGGGVELFERMVNGVAICRGRKQFYAWLSFETTSALFEHIRRTLLQTYLPTITELGATRNAYPRRCHLFRSSTCDRAICCIYTTGENNFPSQTR